MVNSRPARISFYVTFVAIAFNVADSLHAAAENDKLLTGKAAMGDWTSDAPGVRRKITVQDCLRQARMLSQLISRTL